MSIFDGLHYNPIISVEVFLREELRYLIILTIESWNKLLHNFCIPYVNNPLNVCLHSFNTAVFQSPHFNDLTYLITLLFWYLPSIQLYLYLNYFTQMFCEFSQSTILRHSSNLTLRVLISRYSNWVTSSFSPSVNPDTRTIIT